MIPWLSKLIDKASEYFAPRKGLIPFVGILLIVINFILQFYPPGWISTSNLFLHLGLIIAILGLMLSRVL